MKTFIILTSFLFSTFVGLSQKLNPEKDLKNLIGKWEGTLTYLDYQTNKPYTMPANIEVSFINSNHFLYKNIYPKEPKANSIDTLKIALNGQELNNDRITSIKRTKNNIIIVTEVDGNDGNDQKKALLRTTYSLDKSKFSISKDVKFDGTSTWIKRHDYSFKKEKH
ncbi:hypothetical protein NAT51_16965 [Flavobacterium amniphilum]|uniref:hypothetical protein n=1 Tax=Flavobacterium amniphilum TaxID=1834035 RepID=UPI00202A4969|nr:hypothetical protein [Flavobacterium amniphilum]MCL9807225.1 hypothetical protein [Flavobacterium amniphilum]